MEDDSGEKPTEQLLHVEREREQEQIQLQNLSLADSVKTRRTERSTEAIKSDVFKYLDQVLQATQLLRREDDDVDDMQVDSSAPRSPQWYIDQIGRTLLEISQLHNISRPPQQHLPPPERFDLDYDKYTPDVPLPTEEETENDMEVDNDNLDLLATETYRLRRIDYLRLLLRTMAPIAMEVSAHVCAMVIRRGNDLTRPSLVLFSVWLPVAPQITQLVSKLLALDSLSCPIPDSAMKATDLTQSSLFVLMEASYHICRFYRQRREPETPTTWWNWSPVVVWYSSEDEVGQLAESSASDSSIASNFSLTTAIRWYAIRVASFALQLSTSRSTQLITKYGLQEEQVQWMIHPWEINHDEYIQQSSFFGQHKTRLWWYKYLHCPSADDVSAVVPVHPYLIDVGEGLLFCKRNPFGKDLRDAKGDIVDLDSSSSNPPSKALSSRLVRTKTTRHNISNVAKAMCIDPNPPPILVCGPQGSGKSCIIRELARALSADECYHHDDTLLEIHVDDEMDAKTLIGSYTVTDIPGQFEWRAGALTQAVRDGKWVLLEDVNRVPSEIMASIVQLLEERLLPLGNGRVERCHPEFRLFGTLTTIASHQVTLGGVVSDNRVLYPQMWYAVPMEPLPFSELYEIARARYPMIPETILKSILEVFRSLDQSGRLTGKSDSKKSIELDKISKYAWTGRSVSVRDLFKVISRIGHTVTFESNAVYTTERQRELCVAEVHDVFLAATADVERRLQFIGGIVAPAFGITADTAMGYLQRRSPDLQLHDHCIVIGRARIPSSTVHPSRLEAGGFAMTRYTLRLMEAIGVCVQENEATLLVGGKDFNSRWCQLLRLNSNVACVLRGDKKLDVGKLPSFSKWRNWLEKSWWSKICHCRQIQWILWEDIDQWSYILLPKKSTTSSSICLSQLFHESRMQSSLDLPPRR